MTTLRVGLLGATGYLGQELLRLLAAHPSVQLHALGSSSHAGRRLEEVLPRFAGVLDAPAFGPARADTFAGCDIVLLATPSGVAKALAPALLAQGNRVIDLSGDHRLADPARATVYYGGHGDAQGEAVYGLPELNGAAIRKARLVANPGCYPTAAALAALPLAKAGLVAGAVIVDAKSGLSGAGRTPRQDLHYAEAAGSMHAYNVGAHRHGPEIAETLGASVVFTPHVVPMTRGILATAYVPVDGPALTEGEVADLYAKAYAGAPCVRVVTTREADTALVAGTNLCDVRPHATQGHVVVVTAAIDNLLKGGAGQAVQNLNVMAGLPETTGLPLVGGFP